MADWAFSFKTFVFILLACPQRWTGHGCLTIHIRFYSKIILESKEKLTIRKKERKRK